MSDKLTQEELATNAVTQEHIRLVARGLHDVVKMLLDRADHHDQSKLEPPEVEVFTEFTPKLAATTYGSAEYNEFKRQMEPALIHHYAKNSHHPEHHKQGINDMSLIDLLEMFVDWRAASKRHNDGNILKSIEINGDRFGMAPQLVRIFENTAKALDS